MSLANAQSKTPEINPVVKIENIKFELGGNLVVKVFDRKGNGFEENMNVVREIRLPVKNGKPINIGSLPEGYYFIAVFHDENDNGKMDYSFLRSPKEGYGFSGSFTCSSSLRPQDYYVFLNEQNKVLSITLCYNKKRIG